MKGYALKKWESTLNFVFMPMDTLWNLSCKLRVIIIISLNIIWCELILRNRGSDHDCSSLVPFLGQVKSLVFCRSIRLPNLYYDLPSSITPLVYRDYLGTA